MKPTKLMKTTLPFPGYKKTINYTTYGILDTSMYPCRWYAGQITQDRNESWLVVNNSTSNFYAKLSEAVEAFKNLGVDKK